MKHTEETKRKISETLKRRGIKPTVLPSKEQCLENLGSHLMKKGDEPWNKGKRCPQLDGNTNGFKKGISSSPDTEFEKGQKPWNYKGVPVCSDCGSKVSRHDRERCVGCSAKARSGENHYAWKGGTGQPFRRTGEYKQWRMSVYRRDWFTCQDCGYKGQNIEAHHIIPWKECDELKYEIKNGITLCRDCHIQTRGRELELAEEYAGETGLDLSVALGLKVLMAIRED